MNCTDAFATEVSTSHRQATLRHSFWCSHQGKKPRGTSSYRSSGYLKKRSNYESDVTMFRTIYGIGRVSRKITRQSFAAINTTSRPFCSVTVGTGKTSRQRNFCNLTAEFVFEKIIKGMIPFTKVRSVHRFSLYKIFVDFVFGNASVLCNTLNRVHFLKTLINVIFNVLLN